MDVGDRLVAVPGQQFQCSLFVQRPAKMEALPILGPQFACRIAIIDRRDILGDAFELHRRDHLDHATQHVAPLLAACPLDQRTVDLDLVEGDFTQIDQRRETGAEIVQCNAASALTQEVDVSPCGIEIDQHGGLGDFELKHRCRKSLALQQVHDLLRRICAADMHGAEIERQPMRCPPPAREVERLLEQCQGEAPDCAQPFGNRNELRRRDVAQFRVIPARQRFE